MRTGFVLGQLRLKQGQMQTALRVLKSGQVAGLRFGLSRCVMQWYCWLQEFEY